MRPSATAEVSDGGGGALCWFAGRSGTQARARALIAVFFRLMPGLGCDQAFPESASACSRG